jgi:hypothetical protein
MVDSGHVWVYHGPEEELAMKQILRWMPLLVALAPAAVYATEESLADKAGRTAKKAGEATEQGIEKGASAANKGVSKAFEVVNDKVFKPADGWIQDKVGNKGSAEKPAGK